MYEYVVLIFLLTTGNVYCQTCEDVAVVSKTTKVNLKKELENLSPNEIVNCLSLLSKEKLNITEAKYIWNSITTFYKDISNIPDDVLSLLHWVTIAVMPEDYQYLTLSNIEVITNFGIDYGLSKDQLLAIADRVREDFGAKQPEDYTVYDLTALRQILCVFNGSEIERIHPKSYKEAAMLIGKLTNCDYEVFESFAKLALDKDAFGSPDEWKVETICILGGVAKYLPEEVISKLKQYLANDNKSQEKDCLLKAVGL